MTLSIMTFGVMTLSTMTFGIMTLSIMTFGINTVSTSIKYKAFCIVALSIIAQTMNDTKQSGTRFWELLC